MHRRRGLAVALALAIVAGACDSGGGNGQAAEAEAPTTTTTEPAPAATIEPSPVSGPFDRGGYRDHDGNELPVEDLPLPAGSVSAHWYRSGDFYSVVYAGATVEELGGCLSPGLIEPDEDVVTYLSAVPAVEGACDGLSESSVVPPSAGRGLKVCDGLGIYETEIPIEASETALQLTAWVGWVTEEGQGGMRSSVDVNIAETPELDYEADAYEIPRDFLPSGTTQISC